MTQRVPVTLTDSIMTGLFFIQQYRFLTITQFARATGHHHVTAADQLRQFERAGVLGFFGNNRLAGNGKTPKAYFLTRKGFDLLREESDIPAELLGTYKEVKVEARWSPQMYHRLRTVDVLIALELSVRRRPRLTIVQTFLEYKRVKRGNQIINETLDYVAAEETGETKIIPDAAFILENIESNRRALFFVEMDMATERIITLSRTSQQTSLKRKFSQYDRYLRSSRYAQKYKQYGDFGYFTMLFVTFGEERVQHIRTETRDLATELDDYYRLTTFDKAMHDFLAGNWLSRALTDTTVYPLVREEVTGLTT
jgi:hypothetical protein